MLLVAAGLFYTNDANRKQQDLALQGQIADRFSKAIDQIGQEDEPGQARLSIRLGGIYALQRLMIDSNRDEPAVVQVLCAFIRTHAARPKSWPKAVPDAPADVRAAVTVLGHRPNPGRYQLDFAWTALGLDDAQLAKADLTDAFLSYAHLHGANLLAAHLYGTDLLNADLTDAYLSWADLRYADLTRADLTDAHLTGAGLGWADLRYANLTRADLTDAHLYSADLTDANLTRADLTGADLTKVTGLTRDQLQRAKVGTTTRLPAGLSEPQSHPGG